MSRRRGRSSPIAWLLILIVVAAASPAFAQATRPTPATTSAFETQSVQRTRSATAATGDGTVTWQRVVVATIVVLLLIVSLRYAAGWLYPTARTGGGRGVRVLSRTPLAPRQQVVLLHVGRRVVVIGDSAGTLSPLAVITDPDEVAEMIGQAASTPAAAGKFRSVFGQAKQPFDDSPETMTAADDPDARPPVDPELTAAEDDIAGLRERMRALAKSMGR